MKVLHVEGGRHLYGGALQVVFLMRGLQGEGVTSLLACPEGSAIAQAAAPHAAVHALPLGGDTDFGLVRRLAALIRTQQPDLVHLHSRRGVDLWGALAARRAGVPVVLSRRVDNREPAPWARWKYRRVDRVVAISEGIRRVLLDEGVPADHVVCVRSAVDTQAYAPDARRDAGERAWFRTEFGLIEGGAALGMAAQFIERKGHRTAIDALPAVLAEHRATRLLLFGQGPLVEPIRQRVASVGLQSRVHFAGFRNDLARVLPQLDLLLHPAEAEGLGVALLQAAACGVPIVAGRAGGLNGELIEPGDAAALARQVCTLLADAPRRAAYGQAGRALVLSEFSIDAMVRGNLAIYREVLRRRGRPAA
jgi:glycosyltransferase involved in cell wall biosynthesis